MPRDFEKKLEMEITLLSEIISAITRARTSLTIVLDEKSLNFIKIVFGDPNCKLTENITEQVFAFS